MSQRGLYLDQGVCETRGVVTLEGRPERLLIERPGDLPALRYGARSVARILRIERSFNSAFLALPGGGEAILALKPDGPAPPEGASLEIEIRAEAREGKLANARLLGPGEGAPRLIQAAPPLSDYLQTFAPEMDIVTGPDAREAADLAGEEAIETVHALPSGGSIAVEPTRALIAIDIDLGAATGDSKKAARRANLEALSQAARILRLKGLAGLAVFDLVGRGHDGTLLLNAARVAFAPDNPGVAIGPVSRFGTMELTLPRRLTPAIERLGGGEGAAHDLIRALERAARSDPGGRFEAVGAPSVVTAATPLLTALNAKLGGRLSLRAESSRTGFSVRPL